VKDDIGASLFVTNSTGTTRIAHLPQYSTTRVFADWKYPTPCDPFETVPKRRGFGIAGGRAIARRFRLALPFV